MRPLIIILSILILTACSGAGKTNKSSLVYKAINSKNSQKCVIKKAKNTKLLSYLKALEAKKEGKKFSFNFLETNISEALIELSAESKIPIVFSENVMSLVSLNINNKTFEESLNMIVKTGGYDYKQYKTFYFVGLSDQNEDSWKKLIYRLTYKLKFMRPEALKKSMPEELAKYISHDQDKSTIHIRAARNELIDIIKYLISADVQRTQIKIQLTILELNKEGASYIGKKFKSGSLFDYEPSSLSSTIPTLINSQSYFKFLYTIKALAKKGHAKIKATPTLMTLEHREAKFQSLNKDLLETESRSLQTRPEFIESGVLFKIIPHIINEDTIRLSIKDSFSSTYDPDTHHINEHKIDTEVEVKNGSSILLGGMIYNKKEKVITRVPVLGDLPLIGNFFKFKKKKKETKEILFSIKPEIHCN